VAGKYGALGERIRGSIDTGLAQAFGRRKGLTMTAPDFRRLDATFAGEDTTILTGSVTDATREKVRYVWMTKRDYLAALKRRSDNGERFKVDLSLMRLYQESPGGTRFWGIVKQTWTTLDGDLDSTYQDQGFLFVNFDFDRNSPGRLNDFRVYYRFWFYDYPSGQRHARVASDIDALLDPSSTAALDLHVRTEAGLVPAPKRRGLALVDGAVIRRMRDDLVGVLRAEP
jgi:hypothetical protein